LRFFGMAFGAGPGASRRAGDSKRGASICASAQLHKITGHTQDRLARAPRSPSRAPRSTPGQCIHRCSAGMPPARVRGNAHRACMQQARGA
jgi:hypothetical protein